MWKPPQETGRFRGPTLFKGQGSWRSFCQPSRESLSASVQYPSTGGSQLCMNQSPPSEAHKECFRQEEYLHRHGRSGQHLMLPGKLLKILFRSILFKLHYTLLYSTLVYCTILYYNILYRFRSSELLMTSELPSMPANKQLPGRIF